MKANHTSYQQIHGRTALVSCVIMFSFFTGCAITGTIIQPDLQSASLPNYIEGTTFVYSDRTWETVQEVTPDSVVWVNHRGRVSIGTADFIYRPSSWQTRTRKGQREFKPVKSFFSQLDETLWPLRTGNAVRFNESSSWMRQDGTGRSYRAEWSCKVQGTERVSVLAGQFDTWKIACTRYSVPSNPEKIARARETKTWYYAPKVGHFVLKKSVYYTRRTPRRLELLAVIPPREKMPGAAQQRLDQSLAKALEYKKSGQSVQWALPHTGISGAVTPTNTFKLSANTFCRQYEQQVTAQRQTKTYYGMACRDSKGRWQIPRYSGRR